MTAKLIELGDFVDVRGRSWLVERFSDEDNLSTLQLSCVSDDAQGDVIEVIAETEIGLKALSAEQWDSIGLNGTDEPDVLAAYLRVVRWNTATAAERDLFQAPFRAGIRPSSYQLLPLRKALRLPRVNLLIADDVGLGKTIEAGLIVRELLLRRRIDFVLVAAPPSMSQQWKDELETKFGLSFRILDRDHIADLRRARGFTVNPWSTGARFIISHRLLTDEVYMSGLRDRLVGAKARSLLILDEAHHAAPAAATKYAVSSQLTKSVRELTELFGHRLFLSATPHNGHSNSFAALLEMLDPQRFERGIEVNPRLLEPVMVRRLKSDLRKLGEAFPERRIEAIRLDGLPKTAPELQLGEMLATYSELRAERIAKLPPGKAAMAKLSFVGLQQRLLSSIAAFAKTLAVHKKSLERIIAGELKATENVGAAAFANLADADEAAELDLEDLGAEAAIDQEEEAAATAATQAGTLGATIDMLRHELAQVESMQKLADAHRFTGDARTVWLTDFIRKEFLEGQAWNRRRLIIFTEYEDSRRWLERHLSAEFAATEQADERILVFSGGTSADRREVVKRAFNADPDQEPVRILICTDAAREGINLQTHCSDLIHLDLPWNPSRLEQRNGRIDRKLQPAKVVTCRYFVYAQRPADIVLDALVRKTSKIRNELGSAGQVLEDRIRKRLAENGIELGNEQRLAQAINDESDADRFAIAQAEMDDAEIVRIERLKHDQEELQKVYDASSDRVGVKPEQLRRVAASALSAAGFALSNADTFRAGNTDAFHLDPSDPAFKSDASWGETFDDLRIRPRKRGERLNDWRNAAPVRAISFEPPILEDGRDAPDVVQVHLEHRLVRRLLSRFIAQGFQSRLERVSVIVGSGAQPRVILMGRLCVYGAGAARLHEELITATAIWSDVDRANRPLKPLGDTGELTTMNQLNEALDAARQAPEGAQERVLKHIQKDIFDLRPGLELSATERLTRSKAQLLERGKREAEEMRKLLEAQRQRISKAAKDFDPNQLALPGIADDERRERIADRKHWEQRLANIEKELAEEPARVQAAYDVVAHRIEPIGLLYLWPMTG